MKFYLAGGLQNSRWAYPRRGTRVLAFQVCVYFTKYCVCVKEYPEERNPVLFNGLLCVLLCVLLVLINHC
jgi:hypothetical protein